MIVFFPGFCGGNYPMDWRLAIIGQPTGGPDKALTQQENSRNLEPEGGVSHSLNFGNRPRATA
jgi:hypothetical protein